MSLLMSLSLSIFCHPQLPFLFSSVSLFFLIFSFFLSQDERGTYIKLHPSRLTVAAMAKFGRQISLRLHTSAGSKGGASHPSFSSLHPSRHTKHILSSAQRLRLGENFSALGSTPGLHLFSLSEAAKTRWKTKSKVQAVHGGRRASTEAKEECSWVDLGLSSEITKSLLKTGFDSPSQTQIISIPDLVKGKDVVIAAETGSGKTVAYLAPLLSRLASVSASPPADSMDPRGSRDEKVGLVLCPNIQLCKQVSKVAKELALHFNQGIHPQGIREKILSPPTSIVNGN